MMRHEVLVFRRVGEVRRSEVIGAFTYALDLTEGQPQGHSIRCCYIAGTIARELGLDDSTAGVIYYATLLKDLGCSSNAARVHELFRTDDLAFKHAWKATAPGPAGALRFVVGNTARGASARRRAASLARVLVKGNGVARELTETRCTRGADIARQLRFGEAVARGIYRLDEHWDGSGRPGGLRGGAIPLASRVALLAQVADVFHRVGGPHRAVEEVARRAGTWLDPELVRAFAAIAERRPFWAQLESSTVEVRVNAMAPDEAREIDEDYLDAIAAAFGRAIDAKSPFTAGHSSRVADLAERLGEHMGVVPSRLRRLRRGALLHDIGKLGVSSAILEKPGKLDDQEWAAMRAHAGHTQAILGRIGAFADMAPIAAAHHERLDGKGYPLGLDERTIGIETRIITLCDVFDALSSDRPYRAAMPVDRALALMNADLGTAFDAEGFEALKAVVSG
ncbi:MAG TPA: HD domain-containing phosphohydrolase [Croceibacterium sp.]|jgi:HD-GYP domain-containing protein (c-di-GMP phosphodiesterase class II)